MGILTILSYPERQQMYGPRHALDKIHAIFFVRLKLEMIYTRTSSRNQ